MTISKRALAIAVFITSLGMMVQLDPCEGASWEGTDDFSGTLAKWDSTYIHPNPSHPSDGFVLNNGHLQFVKGTTTSSWGGSGILIWPQSLPSNTNWVVLVDAHLNPLSVRNGPNQDIRASLYIYESLSTAWGPTYKRGDANLENGTTSDMIGTALGGLTPVEGWDFTLGVSFDASTKSGTSFYYPVGQPSQLVVLTNINVGSWTNMQILLYGLSEYWAVGLGEDWLDNYSVYGIATSPGVGIVKAVRPSFNNLTLGRSYQLQVSTNMSDWVSQGTPFTATNAVMMYPQYWDVDNWNKLFFRLQ